MTRTVQDVMTRTVAVVRDTAPFKEIVALMAECHVSAVPVVDAADHAVGIVSEGDLMLKEQFADADDRLPLFETRRHRRERDKAEGMTAAELMTSPAITVSPTATLAEAARLMHQKRVKRLPVVDAAGRILGIVSRADVIKIFLRPDVDIRRDVADVIGKTLSIDPHRVSVEVAGGVVTLVGQVERAGLVPILIGMVRGVDGVVGIRDQVSFEVDDVTLRPELMTPWGVYAPSMRPVGKH